MVFFEIGFFVFWIFRNYRGVGREGGKGVLRRGGWDRFLKGWYFEESTFFFRLFFEFLVLGEFGEVSAF